MRYVICKQKEKKNVGEKAGFVVLLLAGSWFRDEMGFCMIWAVGRYVRLLGCWSLRLAVNKGKNNILHFIVRKMLVDMVGIIINNGLLISPLWSGWAWSGDIEICRSLWRPGSKIRNCPYKCRV